MRQLLILLFLCLLIVSCGHTSPQDKVLLSRADSMMEAHPDSALTLLQHITDSKRLSSSDHALYALLMNQALDKCNIEVQSDSLIRIATAYYNGRKDFSHAGYAYFYLSLVEENRGDAEGRAAALLKAQSYAARSNNDELKGFIFGGEALMYQSQMQIDSMLFYNKRAFLSFQKAGDRRNAIICLLNLGLSHSLLNQPDSALFYYQSAAKKAKLENKPLLITSSYRQISFIYYKKKNYPMALLYFRLSAQISDDYDYSKWINMGLIYLQMGQLDSARFYLQKCHNPHEMAPTYYRLWKEVNEKEGNLKAALYYDGKLIAAKDSFNQLSLKESFAGLEKKYNYQHILAKNRSLTIHNQRENILILVLLLLISVGTILFSIARNKEKQKQLEQQRLLTAKEEALVKQEQEKNAILQKQLEIQHDSLITINRLKLEAANLIKDEGCYSTMQRKKQFIAEQEKAATVLFQHVIDNVDSFYNNISKRLVDTYLDLNESDILICCFLLAGFDNVSIASLLGILPKSYNMRRTLMRKKFNLSHEANLTEFLSKF